MFIKFWECPVLLHLHSLKLLLLTTIYKHLFLSQLELDLKIIELTLIKYIQVSNKSIKSKLYYN